MRLIHKWYFVPSKSIRGQMQGTNCPLIKVSNCKATDKMGQAGDKFRGKAKSEGTRGDTHPIRCVPCPLLERNLLNC